MNEQEIDKLIDRMKVVFATKADIAGFATKTDLERFATKADLEKFATSEDHVNLEEKVDRLTEITNSIKEDVAALKVHLYDIPTRIGSVIFENEHNQMKEVIKEKLGVEIGV